MARLAAVVGALLLGAACGGDGNGTTTTTSASTSTSVPETTTTTAASASYTVQAGDNLSVIAQRFGTTVEALVEANGIQDPNLIEVGQVLEIPPGP